MAFIEDQLPDGSAERPFAEVVTDRKAELGLSFRALSERTKQLDAEGRGLSTAYLVQLFNANEDPVPRAIRLIAAALDLAPDSFLEYRLHLARTSLDERIDFRQAATAFYALSPDSRAQLTVERSQQRPRRARRAVST